MGAGPWVEDLSDINLSLSHTRGVVRATLCTLITVLTHGQEQGGSVLTTVLTMVGEQGGDITHCSPSGTEQGGDINHWSPRVRKQERRH